MLQVMPNDEWCTPEWLIEKARAVMGGIGLDPATNLEAQKVVKATCWYTSIGLQAGWTSKSVWLNPPYSKTQKWVDKFLLEYRNGGFEQALVLVNNNTETKWFHALIEKCTCVVFLNRRVKFYLYGREAKSSPRQGQVLFYFGMNIEKFCKEFLECGVIL